MSQPGTEDPVCGHGCLPPSHHHRDALLLLAASFRRLVCQRITSRTCPEPRALQGFWLRQTLRHRVIKRVLAQASSLMIVGRRSVHAPHLQRESYRQFSNWPFRGSWCRLGSKGPVPQHYQVPSGPQVHGIIIHHAYTALHWCSGYNVSGALAQRGIETHPGSPRGHPGPPVRFHRGTPKHPGP